MKTYLSYCRFCSDSRYPDARWLIEKDGKITCTNCGEILKIVEDPDRENHFYLEVEKVGKATTN